MSARLNLSDPSSCRWHVSGWRLLRRELLIMAGALYDVDSAGGDKLLAAAQVFASLVRETEEALEEKGEA